MVSKRIDTIFGIEIKKDYINISKIDHLEEGLQLSLIKTVAISTKATTEDSLIDVQVITELLSNALFGIEYEGAKVVVAVQDLNFFKQVCRYPVELKTEKLLDAISDEVASSIKFKEKEVQTAMAAVELESKIISKNVPVLYAAIQKRLLDTLTEVFDILSMDLIDVDLVPLAALRAATWNASFLKASYLSVVIEEEYIDLNVVINGQILLTRTIRMNCVAVAEAEYMFDAVIQKMKQFNLAFCNMYPSIKFPDDALIYSRIEDRETVMKLFQKRMEDEFKCRIINPLNVFEDNLSPKVKEKKTVYDLLEGSVAIGLALKLADSKRFYLKFVEHSDQHVPLEINRKAIGFSGLFLLVMLISIFAGVAFWDGQIKKLDLKIEKTKVMIRQKGLNINSGDKNDKRLVIAGRNISVSDEKARFVDQKEIIKNIFLFIPDEINLKRIKTDSKFKVVLVGSAKNRESVFELYSKLARKYQVELNDIKASLTGSERAIDFEMSFIGEKSAVN
jgi:Tfp pilus assembly PilM family ATPase